MLVGFARGRVVRWRIRIEPVTELMLALPESFGETSFSMDSRCSTIAG